MKLSHTLLLAAVAWMEKGHAKPCEKLATQMEDCLGDGMDDCKACFSPEPKNMKHMDPDAIAEVLRADAAMCTEEGQPCHKCAAELTESLECHIENMGAPKGPKPPAKVEPPVQGGLRSDKRATAYEEEDGEEDGEDEYGEDKGPCAALLSKVEGCIGEGKELCKTCLTEDEANMEEMDYKSIAKFIMKEIAKCTADGQPCASCNKELYAYGKCSIKSMGEGPTGPTPPEGPTGPTPPAKVE